MGARVNGIHEVTGSIPVWSTNFRSPASGDSSATPVSMILVEHWFEELKQRTGLQN